VLETKKKELKMSVSKSHTKVNEIESMLRNTFDPLRGYLGESNKVASRSKAAALKKEDYVRLKDQPSGAQNYVRGRILRDNQNDDLQEQLRLAKKDTDAAKQKAKEVMQDYQKLSASVAAAK
jgi:hypothetical protein